MASPSQSTAAASSSSAAAAPVPPNPALRRDLPVGRSTIDPSIARDLDESRPSVSIDVSIPPSIDLGGVMAAPAGGADEASIDGGALLLDAVEASHEEGIAPLPSSKG